MKDFVCLFHSFVVTPSFISCECLGKPVVGVTIAAWVWLDDTKDIHQIFVTAESSKSPNKKPAYDFSIYANGAVHFSHKNLFSRRTNPVVNSKTWTHVAVTYNILSNEANIYVNGIRQERYALYVQGANPDQAKLSQNWEEEVSIGRSVVASSVQQARQLHGKLDEFYLYPCALGPEKINKLKEKKCEESMFTLCSF